MPASAIAIPAPLVQSVKDGRCILFLGAMASAKSPPGCAYSYTAGPPSGAELANQLAAKADYKGTDKWNLLRVSQYFEQQKTLGLNREELGSAVKAILTTGGILPSPALHMLAGLPFGLILTTNYD